MVRLSTTALHGHAAKPMCTAAAGAGMMRVVELTDSGHIKLSIITKLLLNINWARINICSVLQQVQYSDTRHLLQAGALIRWARTQMHCPSLDREPEKQHVNIEA